MAGEEKQVNGSEEKYGNCSGDPSEARVTAAPGRIGGERGPRIGNKRVCQGKTRGLIPVC